MDAHCPTHLPDRDLFASPFQPLDVARQLRVPVAALKAVLILQFLMVMLVAPKPVPKLTSEMAVGEVILVFEIVRFWLLLPLLLPSPAYRAAISM